MSLIIQGLCARYGASQVLFGLDLEIPEGHIVTLLGRNGMGKTTTVRSIMGMVPERSGNITFHGKSLMALQTHDIAQQGIGLVPEGRRIFPTLSVRENLVATAGNRGSASSPWTMDKVLELFPNLARRLNNDGWQLSGGEQQMLAIGRALMTNPKLLILDEATEGLAPLVREEIWQCRLASRRCGYPYC